MLNKSIAFIVIAFSIAISVSTSAQTTTVVGATPAEFNVSNGTANYSIPIAVAPGRGGMQPELSLNYSSGAGNGVLGLGWSLGGLSAISRCSATIVQDGFNRGVSFDATDRYCLDGQRLIPINGANGGIGTEYKTEIDGYSQITSVGGAVNNPATWVIKTKAGQVITFGGAGDATQSLPQGNLNWSVREINDTTGNNPITYTYFIDQNKQYLDEIGYEGGNVNFVYEQRADIKEFFFSGARILESKRILEVQSFVGNKLFKHYQVDYSNIGANAISAVSSINECDNNNQCISPIISNWGDTGIDEFASLTTSVPSASGNYGANGYSFQGLHDTNGDGLADAVWAYAGTTTNWGTRVAVSLSQGDGTYAPLQVSVPSTSGNYGSGGYSFQGMHDTNGDGLVDAVWAYAGTNTNWGTRVAVSLSQGDGTYAPLQVSAPSTSGNYGSGGYSFYGMRDINSDGRADAVWIFSSTTSNWGTGVAVSLSQGDGTYAPLQVSMPSTSGNYGAGGYSFRGMYDTNGDGLLDAVWAYAGTTTNWGTRVAVSLSQGDGTYAPLQVSVPSTSGNYGAGGYSFQGMHDTNGDGLVDAVWAYAGTTTNWGTRVAVSLSQGDGTYAPLQVSVPSISGNYGAGGYSFQGMHDTNGDGLVDAVWAYAGTTTNWGTRVAVSLSKGNGTYAPLQVSAPSTSGNYGAGGYSFYGMQDINSDGLADAIWVYSSTTANGGVRLAVSSSQGDGTYAPLYVSTPSVSGNYGANGYSFQGVHDTNGDGLADAVWAYAGTTTNWGTRVAVSLSQLKTPRLEEITDSNNNVTSLTYKSLTDPSVYTKGTGAQFPVVDLQYPQYVVSEVETSDGIGGTRTVNYQYEGLKTHVQGRGSYGYSKITETHVETEKTSVTEYDQTGFPFIGNVKKVTELYQGNVINEAVNTYLQTPTGTASTAVAMATSVQKSYELGSTQPVTTVTTNYDNIDTYGNIGRVTVATTGDGQTFTKITDSTYDNDTANWYLGRLREAEVTHQSPYGPDDQRRSAFTYDATTGLLKTESIMSIATGLPLTTTTNTYDAYGQKTQVAISADSETDRTSTTAYDTNGWPTQSCNALNQCESYTYTLEGWLASTTGPNGITTSWGYDGFGRKILENRADGTQTTIGRHFASSGQCGELVSSLVYTCSVTQSSGTQPVIMQYDALGRELRTIKQSFDERLVYSDTVYNKLAQVERVSRDYYSGDHIYWATSEYDALDRITRMTEPGPHGARNEIITQYNGLTTTVISGPEQRAKTTTTNAIGQKIRIDEEEGTYTEYTYNSDGNLLTTQVASNADTIITLSYDEFGRKIGMDDPDMGQWSYSYNAFGELVSQTDAKNQTATMQYDILGRLINRTEPEGVSTWVYGDANTSSPAPVGSIGKLLSESGNGLTKDYSYDSLGRPVSVTTTIDNIAAPNQPVLAQSFTTETSYDSLGRVKRTTYPGSEGFYTENQYNINGFLAAVTGLRAQAESHDYSQLAPLVNDATILAGDYLTKANELRTLGQYYQSQIAYYQSLTGVGAITAGLQTNLSQHQTALSATVTQGQNLSPEFLGHLNNTIIELQTVTGLLTTQTQSYEALAEQLIVLAEQTLAAADHSFQFARTLDHAAEDYTEFASESNTNTITYWRAVDVDASGRISAEVYGNGIVNDYAYNQGTGQLQSIHSSLLIVDPIRHLEYQYDAYNNVTLRDDLINDIHETYEYDRLDRLTATHVNSSLYNGITDLNNTQSLTYDVLGNITHKSDVGAYTYGGGVNGTVGPHAVVQAGSKAYSYDANGNMTGGDGRTIIWSSFNKPTHITRSNSSASGNTTSTDGGSAGNAWSSFQYGADRARFKKVNHKNDVTLYLGMYEQHTRDNGQELEKKHYIYAAGQLVAEHIVIDKQNVPKVTQTRYLHKDSLGSVDLVTDAYANVVDRRSFDSWGKLRELPWKANATLDDPLYLTQLPYTNKGYTGHENVQEVELIHMNGRMYDATLARFISADPHIQAGSLSQSYNRYSYVMNNPMKYTDPSGFFFKKLRKKIKRAFNKIKDRAVRRHKSLDKRLRPYAGLIVGVVVGIFCQVCGGAIIKGAIVGAASGAVTAAATGGNILQGALIGAFTGAVSGYIGGADKIFGKARPFDIGRSLAHGVVGGTVNVIRGGKFGAGFISSAFTKFVSSPIQGYAEGFAGAAGGFSDVIGATVAALVGGTASVLGGGKFANGAQTAAIQYLLNQASDRLKQAKKNPFFLDKKDALVVTKFFFPKLAKSLTIDQVNGEGITLSNKLILDANEIDSVSDIVGNAGPGRLQVTLSVIARNFVKNGITGLFKPLTLEEKLVSFSAPARNGAKTINRTLLNKAFGI